MKIFVRSIDVHMALSVQLERSGLMLYQFNGFIVGSSDQRTEDIHALLAAVYTTLHLLTSVLFLIRYHFDVAIFLFEGKSLRFYGTSLDV